MAKKAKQKGFSLLGFDASHYRQTESYVQAVDALYNQAIAEYSKLADKVTLNPKKPFSFNDYPQTKALSQQITNQLASKMETVISKGSREQWLFACEKNDQFLASILNTSKVPKKTLAKYQDRNLDALSTFQKRKVDGMGLSDRIWNYTGQMKQQMELGIDIALGDGKSAQQLSKELKQYLVDPDKLFRRVRDKHGNLVLSKNAKAFHPGQGKYRSSHKNAMRLTRSEINMAYRESDQLRWQKLDFVVGFEVKLSNNHTLNGVPFTDICDQLVGKYPKTFKFKGWHPQCRCHVVPIMMDPDEFNTDELNELKAAINGTEYKVYQSRNDVSDVPANFKDWIVDNTERAKGWKSQPYFIRDNFEGGSIGGGLKMEVPKPIKVKPIKTLEQIADIQSRWNTRQASNKFSGEIASIEAGYSSVDAITAYASKVKAAIKSGKPVDDVTAMVEKLNNKVSIKNTWDIYKEEKHLGTLLPDVKALKAQYSMEDIKSVYSAVENKLKLWENMSLKDLAGKLTYEIGWVEDYKKYSTWKIAQDAYKKKLATVNYLLDKKAVENSIVDSLKYAKTTMSKDLKSMADDLQKLVNKDADINLLKLKAQELNQKVSALEAKKAQKASKKAVSQFTPTPGQSVSFAPDDFTQTRKDAAFWAKTAAEADKKVRSVLEKVWQGANKEERRSAFYYTKGSSYINEPLRKMHYSGQYVGVQDGIKDANLLAGMVDRSQYDFDMWVQRGVTSSGVQGVFGIDISYMSEVEVRKSLIGKVGEEKGFSSCGNSKGAGFESRPIVYNIYCPKGTKMVYMEPYSQYGAGDKLSWDGIKKHHSFNSEAEMLIQRGTKFRVTKVEKTPYKWYIDIEVVEQL